MTRQIMEEEVIKIARKPQLTQRFILQHKKMKKKKPKMIVKLECKSRREIPYKRLMVSVEMNEIK